MFARSFALSLVVAVEATTPAAAANKSAHQSRAAPAVRAAPIKPPIDDLYRRRGYGQGGLVFGGDTALAGVCADVSFARPLPCEHGGGYGLYGNGLGYPFGF